MLSLKIRTFGSFQVWRGDELIGLSEWPTKKTQYLFKILLVERDHVVPKDRLMEFLWPDLAPSSAANSLRVSISRLRRLLQPHLKRPADSTYIRTKGEGYLFAAKPHCRIDVDIFQNAIVRGQDAEQRAAWTPAISAYQDAVDLYRGDFLEDNPYDDWTINPREHLREAYLDVLSRLAGCHAQRGHYRRALAACHKALIIDALRESVYRQVMVYQMQLGRRDQALRAFERCQQILREEMGVDPMPVTVALHTDILQDAVIEGTVMPAPLPIPMPASPKPGRRLLGWLPFIGRQAELDVLSGHLEKAIAGRGNLVFIVGETGIGKTRLSEEVLALAEDHGAQTLYGQAYEPEWDLSYQPVSEALRRYLLKRLDHDELHRVLGPWATHIALLLPDLKQIAPNLSFSDTLPPEKEQQQLLRGLTQFILSLAAQDPLVIFLDDLHWADASTLRFLHFLARRIERERVLILATCRCEELTPSHPLSAIEQQLARDRLITRLELTPLAPEAVTQLMRHKAAPGWRSELFSQRVYGETDGNPLFFTELLRNLLDSNLLEEDDTGLWRPASGVDLDAKTLPLPESVRSVIEARVRTVGDGGQAILHVATVIGRSFSFDLLREASDLPVQNLLDGLDELMARQLIYERFEVDRSGYDFTHGIIRKAIYEGLNHARRAYLHGKVAAALEKQYQGRIDEVAGWLAYHYMMVGDEEKTIECLLMAGDRARGLYAHEDAIDYYSQALERLKNNGEHERAARTLMKLGLTHQIAFDFEEARRAYNEGFDLWRRTNAISPILRQPPVAHVLRVGRTSAVTTLEPNLAWDSISISVADQLFSGLAQHTPEMEVTPDVAQRWDVSGGGRRYVLHLREDAYWNDGEPLTAGDFEYAWKRLLTSRVPTASLLYDINGAKAFHEGAAGWEAVGVTVLDETTLAIELEGPNGYFPHLLSHNALLPLPKHAVEAHGEDWTQVENIVTNGPFKLEEWVPGQHLSLSRNPRYHGRFLGNVQQVQFCTSPDLNDHLQRYEADELDILRLAYPLPPEAEHVRQRHIQDYVSTPMLYTTFLGANLRQPPCDDPRIRRALMQAVDPTVLAGAVLGGHATPARGGIVPPDMPGHTCGTGLSHDPDRARRLLAEAGFPGGVGFPTVKIVGYSGEHWLAMGRYLMNEWRENLGLESQWTIVEPGTLFREMDVRSPHLFLVGWYADYPDPDNFLRANPFLGATGWRDDRFEGLVEEARRMTDQEKRIKRYQEAEKRLLEAAVIMPLAYGREHWLVKPWVKKLPISPIKWWFWKDVVMAPH